MFFLCTEHLIRFLSTSLFFFNSSWIYVQKYLKALINLQATVAIIAAPVPAVKITPNPSIIFEANNAIVWAVFTSG